jgi:hypothetical protein
MPRSGRCTMQGQLLNDVRNGKAGQRGELDARIRCCWLSNEIQELGK